MQPNQSCNSVLTRRNVSTLKIEIYGEYERNKTGIILFNKQMFDIHVSLAFGDLEKKSKLRGSELQRT